MACRKPQSSVVKREVPPAAASSACCDACEVPVIEPSRVPVFTDEAHADVPSALSGLNALQPTCRDKSGLGSVVSPTVDARGIKAASWSSVASADWTRTGLSRSPGTNTARATPMTGPSPGEPAALSRVHAPVTVRGAAGLGAMPPRASRELPVERALRSPVEVSHQRAVVGLGASAGSLGSAAVNRPGVSRGDPHERPLLGGPATTSRSSQGTPATHLIGLVGEPVRHGAGAPLAPNNLGKSQYEIPIGTPHAVGAGPLNFAQKVNGTPIKGHFYEISLIVVPPAKAGVVSGNSGCPSGRILLSGTERTQVWLRDLDCVNCPLTPTIKTGTIFAIGDTYSPNTGEVGSSIEQPCLKSSTMVDSFPWDYRYNDSMLVRTKTGVIIHTFTLLRRFAPPYGQPVLPLGDPPVGECAPPLIRSVVGVRTSVDCGNTWDESYVDLHGRWHPEPLESGEPAGQYDLEGSAVAPFSGPGSVTSEPPRLMKLRNLTPDNWGIDTTFTYHDPTTGLVFMTTGLQTPTDSLALVEPKGGRGTQILLVSTNDGQDWTLVADIPRAQRFTAMTSTVTAAGKVKLFLATLQDFMPTIYWFDVTLDGVVQFEGYAPVPFALPTDGSLGTPADAADFSVGFLGSNQSGTEAVAGRHIANVAISRAPSDSSHSYVRVAYPHRVNNRELLCVVLVGVPTYAGSNPCLGDAGCIKLANLDVVGLPLVPGVGYVFPHFVESDAIEHKTFLHPIRANSALLKYLAWDSTGVAFGGTGGFIPYARGYYGRTGVTNDVPLASLQGTTPWAAKPCDPNGGCNGGPPDPNACIGGYCFNFVGDYALGGFFVRPEDQGTPRFMIPWQHTGAPGVLVGGKKGPVFTSDLVSFREVQWRVIQDAAQDIF